MPTIYGKDYLNAVLVPVSCVYARGKLQKMLGTDLLASTDVVLFTVDGVWPVRVVDNDGKTHEAVVFFCRKLGGLCVLSSDCEGLKYAASRFIESVGV